MKFFIDTANLSEIQEAYDLGVVDGVTTNPSLMAKRHSPRPHDVTRKHRAEKTAERRRLEEEGGEGDAEPGEEADGEELGIGEVEEDGDDEGGGAGLLP